ncbi:hypothetical protein FQR65_LT12036 [Abscondita terminalis]|nr:hypothetical protein FQR65_LT12036 [Abscondita terminalis]
MDLSGGDNIVFEEIIDAKKICYNLHSEDKRIRKQALIDLELYVCNKIDVSANGNLNAIFNEIHVYILRAFRDKTEAVRSQAIKFMLFFVVKVLPINDYYLTYIFPLFVERIGTVELVEESEEIRLELLQFMQAIIIKYSNTVQLKPFLNDCVIVLCQCVKDKHPQVKEVSCKCIAHLAQALPKDFHMQAESLVKPVLTAFSYQRYKIRVEAIKCMGDIVMHSSYKALEEVAGPMAERLFDQIPVVRQTVTDVVARWLLEYRDRLNDEVEETRVKAHQLWEVIGLQFEKENESELKDQMDYLTVLPKYYPEHLKRPNLGCRTMVQRSVIKIAPALARELGSWQVDVRVRCSQLFCAITQHAEDYLTQHLQDLLPSLYLAARDDDPRVVENVIQGCEYIGLFVPVETWVRLTLPVIEVEPHFGHFTILSALIQGAPTKYVRPSLEAISKVLADDGVCRSRKIKYQRQLVKCIQALLVKCNQDSLEIGEYLFTIIITLVSIRDVQNHEIFDISLLKQLQETFGFLSVSAIWSKYTPNLLRKINCDPKSWTVFTIERCIFETFLLQSGEAFGENLTETVEILEKALDPEADPESRLQTFIALSTALDSKDVVFKNAQHLNNFVQRLLSNILVPSLVWHAGVTAEAMRMMAASCVCSALNPGRQLNLFSECVVFRPFLNKLVPLLLSLTEDASGRSRLLALEALALLKETAVKRNCWEVDDLEPLVVQKLEEARDNVGNEMLKMMQYIFPIVMQIEMDTIQEFGFPEGRESIVKFAQMIRNLEREDAEVTRLHNLIKAYYLPPVSVNTTNESASEDRISSG